MTVRWTGHSPEYPRGVVGEASSGGGGGGNEPFTGRAARGYDRGYDGEMFYLGLALDPAYIEGFVEGCLERIGEDNPDEEEIFRDLWVDETRSVSLEGERARVPGAEAQRRHRRRQGHSPRPGRGRTPDLLLQG